MAQLGRRPGPGTTSDDVLAAARGLFAERGYRATTVRAIAAAAGVTPAMINHFFGGKQQVFLASIRMPLNPLHLLDKLLDLPREQFPELFVRAFVGAWRSEATGPALRMMLRTAMTNVEQAAALRTFAGTVLIPHAAAGLDLPPGRVAAAVSIMVGQAVTRDLIGIEPLASLGEETLVALYTPAVRAALGL